MKCVYCIIILFIGSQLSFAQNNKEELEKRISQLEKQIEMLTTDKDRDGVPDYRDIERKSIPNY